MTRSKLFDGWSGDRNIAPICHARRADTRTGAAAKGCNDVAACDERARNDRGAALSDSPSIVEPRPGEPDLKARKLTRNRTPNGNESRSARFAPAVDDNETLDHLLSVVTDEERLRRFHQVRKCQKLCCVAARRSRFSRHDYGRLHTMPNYQAEIPAN